MKDHGTKLFYSFSIFLFITFFNSFIGSSFGQDTPHVYLNYSQKSSYTDPYRGIHRNGDNLESILIKEIESAEHSIEIAVQELRLPLLAKALVQKSQENKGVKIRVILENTYHHTMTEWQEQKKQGKEFSTAYGETRMLDYVELVDQNKDGVFSHAELMQNDAVYMLEQAGIPIINDSFDGSAGSALMHHKFMIIDQKKVVVTSANFTLSDIHGKVLDLATTGNANALIIFENSKMAELFLEEFNMMYGGTDLMRTEPSLFGVKKKFRAAAEVVFDNNLKVQVQFSPTSKKRPMEDTTSGLIQRTLDGAQKSIDMALFVFSDQLIADKLYEVKEKVGVAVSAMIDPGFAFRYYSEALDMLGLAWRAPNCQFPVGNNPWKNAVKEVGAPQLNSSDKLHHKFAVIDGKKVIFGSKNWTESANFQNNETLLVIENEIIAQTFQEEIHYWQNRTKWGVPSWIEKKEKTKETQCVSQF